MKIICISDTHSKHNKISNIPDGDIIIHAGDVTKYETDVYYDTYDYKQKMNTIMLTFGFYRTFKKNEF